VGFFDSGGEECLPVIGKVPAQLGNFIFALIECLAHKCLIHIPGYRQHLSGKQLISTAAFGRSLN
jgi:hypothetical protein